jgi:hypothetical protein
MTQSNNNVAARPNIVARSTGKESVISTVAAGPAPTGPFSYVTGIPNTESDLIGPPPQYLAVAGWTA